MVLTKGIPISVRDKVHMKQYSVTFNRALQQMCGETTQLDKFSSCFLREFCIK
jgi:hypothetical protein